VSAQLAGKTAQKLITTVPPGGPRAVAAMLAVLALCFAAPLAQAQAWPDKPIRLVSPSPPGGGTDAMARLVANKLGEMLQWQMLVDNRAGAGGNIGLDIAAKAPADGYTLAMGESSNLTINPYLYKKLPYDPLHDFALISVVISAGPVLVVHPSVPARNMKELVALAKSRPGQLNYGSGGIGTTAHISGEFLQRITGTRLLHVPYKGGAMALIDLVGGQTDLQFGDMVPSVPMIRAGKVRALAVTTPQRSKALPETPTMGESGVKEAFPTQWWGVAAPKGTPRPIVDRINAELGKIAKASDVLARFDDLGVFPEHTTPEKMLEMVKAEGPAMGKLLQAAGVDAQ
jgi:tripartite-type tricarboxylate transporter receptor subunit TctC